MELITIRTFDNYFNANVTLTRLQNAGIECYLKDEFTVTIDPLLTNAVGGIKLVVKDIDANDAIAMLNEMDTIYRQSAICPQCGTDGLNYVSRPGTKKTVNNFLAKLFSSNSISTEIIYHCDRCGWEGKDLPDHDNTAIEE